LTLLVSVLALENLSADFRLRRLRFIRSSLISSQCSRPGCYSPFPGFWLCWRSQRWLQDADKTDFPGIAGLGNGLVSPLGSQHLLESVCIGYVVKLVNVDPVGLKLPQREVQVIRSTLAVSLGGFRGDDDLASDRRQGDPEFFFARGVHVGRIEKRDPQVEAVPDDSNGFILRQRVNRDAPEAYLGNLQRRGPESSCFHFVSRRETIVDTMSRDHILGDIAKE